MCAYLFFLNATNVTNAEGYLIFKVAHRTAYTLSLTASWSLGNFNQACLESAADIFTHTNVGSRARVICPIMFDFELSSQLVVSRRHLTRKSRCTSFRTKQKSKCNS